MQAMYCPKCLAHGPARVTGEVTAGYVGNSLEPADELVLTCEAGHEFTERESRDAAEREPIGFPVYDEDEPRPGDVLPSRCPNCDRDVELTVQPDGSATGLCPDCGHIRERDDIGQPAPWAGAPPPPIPPELRDLLSAARTWAAFQEPDSIADQASDYRLSEAASEAHAALLECIENCRRVSA